MKKFLTLIIACFSVLPVMEVKSQVAINTTGNAPDASAMLDVVSSSKGLLIPRLTAAEIAGIAEPANGLLVYQTDGITGFYYYNLNTTSWVLISSGSYTETDPVVRAIVGIVKSDGTTISAAVSGTDYAPATSGTSILKGNGSGGFSNAVAGTDYEAALGNPTVNGYVLSSTTGGVRSWIPTGGGVTSVTGTAPVVSSGGTTPAISMHVADISDNGYLSSSDWTKFNNNKWSFADPYMYYTGGVAIGTSTPNTSAVLDLESTNQGFLVPRVSSTASVTSPATGLLVYQTGSPAGFYYYTGSLWTILLPPQTGKSGSYLTTSGTSASWATLPNTNYWTKNLGTIYTSSQVGIGMSTSPSNTLEVLASQTEDYTALIVNTAPGSRTNGGLLIQAGLSGGADTNIYYAAFEGYGDIGPLGGIYWNGSKLVLGSVSDQKLKENIINTHYSLTDLMKIKVRDFYWKNDLKKNINTGFIAQELYNVYPSAVRKPKTEKENWMVSGEALVPLLVKSIQDQQGEIDSLKTQLNSQKALIDNLLQRVQALEKK
jgi:hypothetical protein